MTKEKEENIDLGEKLSKAEHYVSDNRKSLSIIGGAIVAVLAIYFGYRQFIVKPQEENAQKEILRCRFRRRSIAPSKVEQYIGWNRDKFQAYK